MRVLIKRAIHKDRLIDILIKDGRIEKISEDEIKDEKAKVIDAKDLHVLPAFIDMHVHLREPGQEYKEDLLTGARAAVAGGFSAVCTMPNTNPVVDNEYLVKYILNRSKEINLAKIYPIAAVTTGQKGDQLASLKTMHDAGAIAFSDDGLPVMNANTVRLSLEYASAFDGLIISHCEDEDLADGGCVNEGKNATIAGLKGINKASEEVMVAREIIIAENLKTRVHIAHVSTKGSVQLIREAKKRGVKVTCETTPHYINLTDDLILTYNTNTKVNPPLREEIDKEAIIEGIFDGTIDTIVTDHAPHSVGDKNVEYPLAANGISGLETSFCATYTKLVKEKGLSLEKLSEIMTKNAAKILKIECGDVKKGALADLVLVDLSKKVKVDTSKFFSKGKNTPFEGMEFYGKVECTIVNGEVKFYKGEITQ